MSVSLEVFLERVIIGKKQPHITVFIEDDLFVQKYPLSFHVFCIAEKHKV